MLHTSVKCSQLDITFSVATPWTGTLAASNDSGSQTNEASRAVRLGTASDNLAFTFPTTNPGTGYAYFGMRFTNVTIPKGSAIKAAHLRFTMRTSTNREPQMYFGVFTTPNPPVFTTADYTVSSRPLWSYTRTYTHASPLATWTRTEVPLGFNYTTTIKRLIQHVVTQPGWASGNALGIRGWQLTSVVSFSTYGSTGPVLIVTYTPPG